MVPDLSHVKPKDLIVLTTMGDRVAAQELFHRCEPEDLAHAVELVDPLRHPDARTFDAVLDGYRAWLAERSET